LDSCYGDGVWNRLLVLLVASFAFACGSDAGDGGPIADGGTPDALFCNHVGVENTGFNLPDVTVEAFERAISGGWVSKGPADFSCLDTPRDDAPSTRAMTISGTVVDFQGRDPVGQAIVEVWPTQDTRAAVAGSTTADQDGNYSLVVPAGAFRPAFRVTADGLIDDYRLNTALPTEPTHVVNLEPWSAGTVNAISFFIGVARMPGLGMTVWTMRDCGGDLVAHAVATVSTTPAADGCPTHAAGADTYYFDADSQSLPVRHSQRLETDTDGLFMVIDIPVMQSAYVQVWGFTADQTPSTDQPRLLAELPIEVVGDAMVNGTLEPRRSN
jgi:hypothetical protein